MTDANGSGRVAPGPAPSPDAPVRVETLLAQGGHRPSGPWGEVVAPIHLSTTYERAPDGSYPGGATYARDRNPAFLPAERMLCALEGGVEALLFSSGMAAACAVFQGLKPGARVVAPAIMYWGLRKWLHGFAEQWGLHVDWFDARVKSSAPTSLASLLARPADLLWLETPANPTWEITDIAEAVALARAAGARIAVDSTVATPVFTRPLALGADIVMHSATKYLNGHGDVVAGALVTAVADEHWQAVRAQRGFAGAIPGPMQAWLLARGMRTLMPRVRSAAANAQRFAQHFEGRRGIRAVLYPGLASHPGNEIAARQMQGGFGAMLSVRVDGGAARAMRVAAALEVFVRATSLGSTESLVEHRASIEGPGTVCPDDLLRLSIGIEAIEDLIEDFERALERN